MRLCRFGDGRLGLVEGDDRQGCHRGARRASAAHGIRCRSTTSSSRISTRWRRARARSPRTRRRCRSIASTLLSPVANPGQDHRGAGELPEAPRRGARQPAAARQQSRPHVHDSQRRAVSQGDQLARRAGAGRRDPLRRAAHRSRGGAGVRHRHARRAASRATRRWPTSPATRSASTSRFAAPRTAASASRRTRTACSARGS